MKSASHFDRKRTLSNDQVFQCWLSTSISHSSLRRFRQNKRVTLKNPRWKTLKWIIAKLNNFIINQREGKPNYLILTIAIDRRWPRGDSKFLFECWKRFHEWAKRTSKIFTIREEKFCISKRPNDDRFTFAAKGTSYQVTTVTVLLSCVKTTCYFHLRWYQVSRESSPGISLVLL